MADDTQITNDLLRLDRTVEKLSDSVSEMAKANSGLTASVSVHMSELRNSNKHLNDMFIAQDERVRKQGEEIAVIKATFDPKKLESQFGHVNKSISDMDKRLAYWTGIGVGASIVINLCFHLYAAMTGH